MSVITSRWGLVHGIWLIIITISHLVMLDGIDGLNVGTQVLNCCVFYL